MFLITLNYEMKQSGAERGFACLR